MRIRDPGWKNTDPGRKKFGSGINIPDPQPCWLLCFFGKGYCIFSCLRVANTFFAICGVWAVVQQVVQDEKRAARPPCPPPQAARQQRVLLAPPAFPPRPLNDNWKKADFCGLRLFFAYLLNLALKETVTWECVFYHTIANRIWDKDFKKSLILVELWRHLAYLKDFSTIYMDFTL
jgi:hypothetical protein